MIKVLYSGYMVRDMCGNHHAYSTVGKDPEPVKGYFCLCDDDIETLNDFGKVKIHAVIGERLDEYDMLIWEEGDALPLVQYSGLFTDRMGEETPFVISISEEQMVSKKPIIYEQDNGNQLKIFFNDEDPQINPEPPINPPADNLEPQPNQTKPRQKLKPLERETNECLLLIYEMTAKYDIQYLDQFNATKLWGFLISMKFTSDLIKSIADNKKYITSNGDVKIEKAEFLKKYKSRFTANSNGTNGIETP